MRGTNVSKFGRLAKGRFSANLQSHPALSCIRAGSNTASQYCSLEPALNNDISAGSSRTGTTVPTCMH
jgi:hypothetical protein